MYCLPQAGTLANKLLVKQLAKEAITHVNLLAAYGGTFGTL
jgi:hypothetical protein